MAETKNGFFERYGALGGAVAAFGFALMEWWFPDIPENVKHAALGLGIALIGSGLFVKNRNHESRWVAAKAEEIRQDPVRPNVSVVPVIDKEIEKQEVAERTGQQAKPPGVGF